MRTPALLLLVACGGSSDVVWEPRSQTDLGTACLEAAADAEGTVYVDANLCLSSSCDDPQTATCTATLDGTTITVSAEFEWLTAIGDIACTEDCNTMEASCAVGPLPAGDYTVVLGDDSQTVTVPTSGSCAAF